MHVKMQKKTIAMLLKYEQARIIRLCQTSQPLEIMNAHILPLGKRNSLHSVHQRRSFCFLSLSV